MTVSLPTFRKEGGRSIHVPDTAAVTKATVALSLAAAFLTGCSGDLSVKSDLGEEVFVKKSAVTVSAWGKEEAEQKRDAYQKAINAHGLELERCPNVSPSRCRKIWLTRVGRDAGKMGDLDKFIDADIIINLVSYTPVSVDLNGVKTPGKHTTAACIPKTFDDEQSIVASRAAKAASLDLVESHGVRAKDSVKWRVCQRFGGA